MEGQGPGARARQADATRAQQAARAPMARQSQGQVSAQPARTLARGRPHGDRATHPTSPDPDGDAGTVSELATVASSSFFEGESDPADGPIARAG